jgi:hypothetical protein
LVRAAGEKPPDEEEPEIMVVDQPPELNLEDPDWWFPILEWLAERNLPPDQTEARHIARRAKAFVLIDGDLQISQSPRAGASGAAASAATSRLTSRSPAPRSAGPQEVMGGLKRSWSLPRGPGQPSSRRDEAAASGAAQLLGHGTARGLQTR